MRDSERSSPGRGMAIFPLALALAGLLPGCGPGRGDSPMSPVVSAESEEGARARAQDQRLREERQRQEAALRRRPSNLPAEE